MPSDMRSDVHSMACRIIVLASAWLFLISGLHYWLNLAKDDRTIVRMGYMPVVTNLAAPLLDFAAKDDPEVQFEALKFASFAEMAEALRNDQIQFAFIIAPLSIVLKQQGADIKVVYIGNRHESTLVTRKDLHVDSIEDLVGKTVAVPMRYSGHNLAMHQQLAAKGILDKVNIVELNPPDMASALTSGALDAYFVGEPFAAQTLRSGDAELLFYVEEIWHDFICNLVIAKQSFIEEQPELVTKLVHGAARSGVWARDNVDEAAEIASIYWNQPEHLIKYALTTPENRIIYDRYLPDMRELQQIAELMERFGLLEQADIKDLVDDRFARSADLSGISDISSILSP